MKVNLALLIIGILIVIIAAPSFYYGAVVEPAEASEANIDPMGMAVTAIAGLVVGLTMAIIGGVKLLRRR